MAREPAHDQRGRRHHRGDRRCDPLRLRHPLLLHGQLPDLHAGRRRCRHAALHGAVRPGARTALDQAEGPEADRRADRPRGRRHRPAEGHAARSSSSSAIATTAIISVHRRDHGRQGSATDCARTSESDDDRRAAQPLSDAGEAGMGGLQQPPERRLLPGHLQPGRRRRVHELHRHVGCRAARAPRPRSTRWKRTSTICAR